MGLYHVHTTIVNSLGGRHIHITTQTDVCTETILRNQACAWFKNQSIIIKQQKNQAIKNHKATYNNCQGYQMSYIDQLIRPRQA